MNLTEAIEQDALAAERQALDLIAELAALNEVLGPAEKRKAEITVMIKQYLALEQLDSLHDGERGITARLQDRNGTPTYDLVTLAQNDEQAREVLWAAAMAGMARIDHVSLSRFRKDAGATWADRLAKYEMPGTSSVALVLERDKR